VEDPAPKRARGVDARGRVLRLCATRSLAFREVRARRER